MLMNKNSGPANGEAKLQYGPSGFRVLRAGNHVFVENFPVCVINKFTPAVEMVVLL